MLRIRNIIEYDSDVENMDEDIINMVQELGYEDKIDFISVQSIEDFISLELEDACKRNWFIDYFVNSTEDYDLRESLITFKAKLVIDFLKSDFNLDGSRREYLIKNNNIISIYFS